MITVKIAITLKNGILDAQGQTICHALQRLDQDTLTDVQVGKLFTLYFDEKDINLARKKAIESCERLLANPVMETYSILSVS